MSTYVAEHAGALEDVAAAGTAVTFTHVSAGTYDATTDTYSSPSTTTVAGSAIQVQGSPEVYKALELVESEAPTLLFVPNTIGSLPALNDTVPWGGVTFAAKSIQPIAPNGTAIAAYVIVGR